VAVEIPTSSSREVTAVGVFWLKSEVPEKVFGVLPVLHSLPWGPSEVFHLVYSLGEISPSPLVIAIALRIVLEQVKAPGGLSYQSFILREIVV
jgi:hypothetical protein